MKALHLVLSCLILICMGSVSYGQTSGYDMAGYHMRYWKARGRLVGDQYNRDKYNGFMVVGDQPGMSLPAEFRVPNKPAPFGEATIYNIGPRYFDNGGNCSSQPGINSNDPRDGQVKSGFLNWGDAPIQLSHYIIALCYEWQLLNRSHDFAIVETEKELYYALKAIERLDIFGEMQIPGYNMNTPLAQACSSVATRRVLVRM